MAPPKRPWFRFYVEAMRDPKLRMLPPAHRWLWVAVLGCARQSPLPGVLLVTDSVPMNDQMIADEAALPLRETRKGLEALAELELIDWDGDAWVVTKWKERQFESDETVHRTRKHRSKQRGRNVPSSGDVAPPENREQITEDPPTPQQVGGRTKSLRSNGNSPRQLAALKAREKLELEISECPECGGASWTCTRCAYRKRQLEDVMA